MALLSFRNETTEDARERDGMTEEALCVVAFSSVGGGSIHPNRAVRAAVSDGSTLPSPLSWPASEADEGLGELASDSADVGTTFGRTLNVLRADIKECTCTADYETISGCLTESKEVSHTRGCLTWTSSRTDSKSNARDFISFVVAGGDCTGRR